MTPDEYAEIAHTASIWARDQQLPPNRRRLAKSLYELAHQLTDPDYGCPTETFAVLAMYRHLQKNMLH
jgi:hypothetical protein